MGAWLVRVLAWLGTASIGYFANDIGDGIARYVPETTDPKTGKTRWYVIVLIMFGAFVVLYFLIQWLWSFVPKNKRRK